MFYGYDTKKLFNVPKAKLSDFLCVTGKHQEMYSIDSKSDISLILK